MKKENKNFLGKYFTENNREKQLCLLKDFMLSKTKEELLAFNEEHFSLIKEMAGKEFLKDKKRKTAFWQFNKNF